jgi:NAD+ kinase
MKRVGLVVHPTRPVPEAVDVVKGWTMDHGLELVQVAIGQQPRVAPDGAVSACDLIVAIGGDGTILKALHASAGTQTPVLGVAYGSLGALTAVPTPELGVALDRFAIGEVQVRELPALVVCAGDEQISSAINDMVVARGRGTQLLLDLYVDGELYARLAGDGLVLATPLGSSAYSMAAGGPLLAAEADVFVCTPLAMHGGCAPPFVVAAGGEVTLEVHPSHSGFYVEVDGFALATQAQEFAITRTAPYARLVAGDDFRTNFPHLRARRLISDSPRVVRHDEREAQTEIAT